MAWLLRQMCFYLTVAFVNTISQALCRWYIIFWTLNEMYKKQHDKTFADSHSSVSAKTERHPFSATHWTFHSKPKRDTKSHFEVIFIDNLPLLWAINSRTAATRLMSCFESDLLNELAETVLNNWFMNQTDPVFMFITHLLKCWTAQWRGR